MSERATRTVSGKRRILCGSGHVRCWFIWPNTVGVRTPVCQRHGCYRKNPAKLEPWELAEYGRLVDEQAARRAAATQEAGDLHE